MFKYTIQFETTKWILLENIFETVHKLNLEETKEKNQDKSITVNIRREGQGSGFGIGGPYMTMYQDVFPRSDDYGNTQICCCQTQHKVCTHGNATTWNTDD